MPKSSWIQGAELIPENRPYKVDSSSRVIIPTHLKSRSSIENGDYMDYYTTFIDDKWFICCCVCVNEDGVKIDNKGRILRDENGELIHYDK